MKKSISILNISKIMVLMLISTLVYTACGSGGGGGGGTKTEANLTVDNAPKALSVATGGFKLVGMSMSLGELGGLAKSQSQPSFSSPLRSIIDRVISISRGNGDDTEMNTKTLGRYLQRGNDSFTEDCSDGGSISASGSWDGPAEPEDASEMTNLKGSITFKSCREGTEVMNGTLTFAFSGPYDDPEKLTISASNLSYSDTATKDSLSLRNFNMVLTDLTFDTYYGFTGATIMLSGAASGTVDGDPIDSELDNFKIVFNSNSNGESIAISGSMRDACLDGWITVETTEAIYIPYWSDCPTAGEIVISSGEDSIKATIKSNSEISVFFNNDLIETYDNCEDVEGLCAG